MFSEKLIVTATDETALDFVTYRWNNDEEQKVEAEGDEQKEMPLLFISFSLSQLYIIFSIALSWLTFINAVVSFCSTVILALLGAAVGSLFAAFFLYSP